MVIARRKNEAAVILDVLALRQLRSVERKFHRIANLTQRPLLRIEDNAQNIQRSAILVALMSKRDLRSRVLLLKPAHRICCFPCGSKQPNHGGDLSPGQPGRFPHARSRGWSNHYQLRAPPQESSSPSGVASLAHGQHRVVKIGRSRQEASGCPFGSSWMLAYTQTPTTPINHPQKCRDSGCSFHRGVPKIGR
jgi:hypothetical protein